MGSQASERTGAAIRKLRMAKGWTLAQLSEHSGIALATLSRIELGQTAVNYDKLMRLCQALDVDVGNLIARESSAASVLSGRRAVTRAGQGQPMALGPHAGRRAADDLLDKSFSPVVLDLTVASLAEHGPMLLSPGEVYVLVTGGRVVLHSELYAPLALGVGDGVYFDGRTPYTLLAGDSSGARVLLVQVGDLP